MDAEVAAHAGVTDRQVNNPLTLNLTTHTTVCVRVETT